MNNEIEKITFKEAIKLINTGKFKAKGWEYLTRLDGKVITYLPSVKVVEKFKNTIGDKWSTKKPGTSDMIYCDLLDTNIIFDGIYIYARGGLCPSGVRLFEISDYNETFNSSLLIKFLEDNSSELK